MPSDRALEIEAAWILHERTRGLRDDRAIPGMLAKLAEAQNWRCCYCGIRMEMGGKSGARATFEHFIPRALGGSDRRSNLVAACLDCNQSRGCGWYPEHTEALDAE